MTDLTHLAPGWQGIDDHELRDLIEMNERQFEFIRGHRRFRGRKTLIRRYTARLAALHGEEDRRIREELKRVSEQQFDISKLKIIGAAKVEGNADAVWHVWFDPDSKTTYEHKDGHWIPLAVVTPEVQSLIDREVNTMPVLELRSPEYFGAVMYLDTLKGIEGQLEVFLGEDDFWREMEGGSLTITITRMNKAEFAALEPLEL